MTEQDYRRIAREEAQRVLAEHLELQRQRRERKQALEEKIHEEAMEDVFGPYGQG